MSLGYWLFSCCSASRTNWSELLPPEFGGNLSTSTNGRYEMKTYYFILALWVLAIGGWIANIYKFISGFESLAEITAMQIFRIIGVFLAPLGAVLGFF